MCSMCNNVCGNMLPVLFVIFLDCVFKTDAVTTTWSPPVQIDNHVTNCAYLRPYQVVLFSQDEFLCLGNLISFLNVLTCCQCFIRLEPRHDDDKSKLLIDTEFKIREGVVVKAGFHCSDQFKQYRRGESYAFDPECKREKGVWEHDAAIMRVSHEFHESPYVAPINFKFGEYDAEILQWTSDSRNFIGVKCYVEGLWHSKHNYSKSVKHPVQYDKCPYRTEYNICAQHQHPLPGFCSKKNLGSALLCQDLVIGYLTDLDCNHTQVKMTFHKIVVLNHLIWAALQEPGSIQFSAARSLTVAPYFVVIVIVLLVKVSNK